jgi:hypothetical protein
MMASTTPHSTVPSAMHLIAFDPQTSPFYMEKTRLSKTEWSIQGHTAEKWQSQDSKVKWLGSKAAGLCRLPPAQQLQHPS